MSFKRMLGTALAGFLLVVHGEQKQVDSVIFDAVIGNQIQREVQNFQGKLWDKDEAKRLVALLEDHHNNTGFPAAEFVLDFSCDSLCILTVSGSRGERWVLGSIQVPDSMQTSAEVVQKLSLLKDGEYFSLKRVGLGIDRLNRTGWFELDTLPQWHRDGLRNRLVPLLNVRDLPTGELSGAGQLEGQSWGVDFGAKWFNILGTARTLELNIQHHSNWRNLQLYYREPWLLQSDFSLWGRGSIFADSLYQAQEAELGTDAALNFQTTIVLSGGRRQWQSENLDRDLWFQRLVLERDTRNRLVLADRGTLLRTEAKTMQVRHSSDRPWEIQGQWQALLNAWSPLYIQAGARGAVLGPLEDLLQLEYLEAGGPSTWMRGVPPRSLKVHHYGAWMLETGYTVVPGAQRWFFFTDQAAVSRSNFHRGMRWLPSWGLGWTQASAGYTLRLLLAQSPDYMGWNSLLGVSFSSRF